MVSRAAVGLVVGVSVAVESPSPGAMAARQWERRDHSEVVLMAELVGVM